MLHFWHAFTKTHVSCWLTVCTADSRASMLCRLGSSPRAASPGWGLPRTSSWGSCLGTGRPWDQHLDIRSLRLLASCLGTLAAASAVRLREAYSSCQGASTLQGFFEASSESWPAVLATTAPSQLSWILWTKLLSCWHVLTWTIHCSD